MTITGKILPPHLTFSQALQLGYCGRIECRPYLDWIKTLPCATCGAHGPSDPSHMNAMKGMGTKSPDFWAIPQCRRCHENYEHGPEYVHQIGWLPENEWRALVALYLLQAIFEGRLTWTKL